MDLLIASKFIRPAFFRLSLKETGTTYEKMILHSAVSLNSGVSLTIEAKPEKGTFVVIVIVVRDGLRS